MPMSSTARFALAGLAITSLWGCTRAENDRIELGRDTLLATFQEPVHTMSAAEPSITGLDRSNWTPVLFEVPVNGVAHSPPYGPPTFDLDSMPRQRGEEPTAETCLDLGVPDTGAEIGQTLRSHGLAVVDALLLVPRLVIRPPTATNWSPVSSYDRAPDEVITAPWCTDCDAPCLGECADNPAEPSAEPSVEPAAPETATPDTPPATAPDPESRGG